MWPFTLSGRLPIVALVGHYPTNKLIGRGLIQRRQVPKDPRLSPHRLVSSRTHAVLPPVSRGYPPPRGRLPTRYSPVRCSCTPEGALPLNLHVLGTPPAFILSQDQTLQLKMSNVTPMAQRSSQREFSLLELISVSVARSKDQMTEVRWFLSIQFSKSLVPWRAYQSRALSARCQALFNRLIGVLGCLPTTWGAQQYGSSSRLSTPPRKVFSVPAWRAPETSPQHRRQP